jgi:hypothetical protein
MQQLVARDIIAQIGIRGLCVLFGAWVFMLATAALAENSVRMIIELRTEPSAPSMETPSEETECPPNCKPELLAFAIDGFQPGTKLMESDLAGIRSRFGEPREIEEKRAYWDIDVQIIPIEWKYDGFVIKTENYRDGIPAGNTFKPGPVKVGNHVTGIVLTSAKYPLRHGLKIGSTRQEVIRLFGFPSKLYREYPQAKEFPYRNLPMPSTFNVDVEITFDVHDAIEKILWERSPWH